MYWQVYLHKTVISSEHMLIQLIKRAIYLVKNSKKIYLTPELKYFLKNNFNKRDLKSNNLFIKNFSNLDDHEIFTCLKYWTKNTDYVLSKLARRLLNRNLLKIRIQKQKFTKKTIEKYQKLMIKKEKINANEASYFIFTNKVSNSLYSINNSNIKILFKNGKTKDLSQSSEQFINKSLEKTINKYFLCSPEEYFIN